MKRLGEAVVLPEYLGEPETLMTPAPLGVAFFQSTLSTGGSVVVTETMHARETFVPITAV